MLRAKNNVRAQIERLTDEIDTANKMLIKIPEEGIDQHGRPYIQDGANLAEWISKAEDRLTTMKKEPVRYTYVKRRYHGKTKEGLTYTTYRKKRVYRDIKGRFAKRPPR